MTAYRHMKRKSTNSTAGYPSVQTDAEYALAWGITSLWRITSLWDKSMPIL